MAQLQVVIICQTYLYSISRTLVFHALVIYCSICSNWNAAGFSITKVNQSKLKAVNYN